MPYKPKRPCSHPGCPRLTDGRYCEEHEKAAARHYERYDRSPEARKYYGASWRKVRKKFLEEHPLCELCQRQGILTPATLVHHIKVASEGGSNDEENLMALCPSCHSRLHAQRGDRWNVKR